MLFQRKNWLRTGAGLALVLAASACSSSAATTTSGSGSSSQAPVSVTFAGPTLDPPSVSNITENVALTNGYFSQNGINATFKQTAGSPLTIAAIKSGSADFGFANMEVMATADAQGANLEMVCAMTFKFPGDIVASKNVTNISQLTDGKTIVAETAAGATDYNVIVAYLRSVGQDPDKVHFATTGAVSNSTEYLIGGRVNVTWLPEPEALLAEAKNPSLHNLVNTDQLYTAYPDYGGIIVTSKSYAQAHPDTVTRICKSIIEANRALVKSQSTLNTIVNKLLPGQYTATQLNEIYAAYQPAYGANGGISATSIANVQKVWQTYVDPKDAHNSNFSSFTQLVDPQYVQAAIKQLGGTVAGRGDTSVAAGGAT
jgi:ABC-type nitrate/sulfonate/bicarbonate transport system substrate-binding protein